MLPVFPCKKLLLAQKMHFYRSLRSQISQWQLKKSKTKFWPKSKQPVLAGRAISSSAPANSRRCGVWKTNSRRSAMPWSPSSALETVSKNCRKPALRGEETDQHPWNHFRTTIQRPTISRRQVGGCLFDEDGQERINHTHNEQVDWKITTIKKLS